MNKTEIAIIAFFIITALFLIFSDHKFYKDDSLFADSKWSANVVIDNRTPYIIDITGVGVGNGAIPPNSQYSWFSTDVNNTKSMYFAALPMTGNLSFGPDAGVYVDRGEQEKQTIVMTVNANDATFVQDKNGGEQILKWNEFENGGEIFIKFEMISY